MPFLDICVDRQRAEVGDEAGTGLRAEVGNKAGARHSDNIVFVD
jgi:hypothetical protein